MYFVTSLISCTSCVSDQLINKEVLGPESRLLLSKRRNYFQSLQSLSPPGSDERKYFSMVVSRKLGGNERNSTERQLRHKTEMTHLWQFLLQRLKNDSFSSIISWSRKHHSEFKVRSPKKLALRWGIFKRNKAVTYKKLSRALKYSYQLGNIKTVPGQKFLYRLNKRPLTGKPGIRKSRQVKSAPQENTGSSFIHSSTPNTTPLMECWSRPVVPMSCCPRCLCPRFIPPTTPSSGEGRKIPFQIFDRSLNELVLPIKPPPTSIPVSVIQKTTTSRIDS